MFKGPKVKPPSAQNAPAAAASAAPATPAKRHMLDSTDDEAEEKAASPKVTAVEKSKNVEKKVKKAKRDDATSAADVPAATSATPTIAPAAAFAPLDCIRATLAKKGGSASLKQLRKALIKAAPEGLAKAEADRMLTEHLLAHADDVKVIWSTGTE
jgi:hypothetical protein